MDVSGSIRDYVSARACEGKHVGKYIRAKCNCIICTMYIGGDVSMSVCV